MEYIIDNFSYIDFICIAVIAICLLRILIIIFGEPIQVRLHNMLSDEPGETQKRYCPNPECHYETTNLEEEFCPICDFATPLETRNVFIGSIPSHREKDSNRSKLIFWMVSILIVALFVLGKNVKVYKSSAEINEVITFLEKASNLEDAYKAKNNEYISEKQALGKYLNIEPGDFKWKICYTDEECFTIRAWYDLDIKKEDEYVEIWEVSDRNRTPVNISSDTRNKYAEFCPVKNSFYRTFFPGCNHKLGHELGYNGYAERVLSNTYHPRYSEPEDEDAKEPRHVLGVENYSDGKEGDAYSMGCKGELVVEFADVQFCNGDGWDICIFETGRVMEDVEVYVSKTGGDDWIEIGETVSEEGMENDANSILSTEIHDSYLLFRAHCLDMSEAEETISPSDRFRYIRLVDKGDQCKDGGDPGPYPGADIDAIRVRYGESIQ
jgi:hypothetical protein